MHVQYFMCVSVYTPNEGQQGEGMLVNKATSGVFQGPVKVAL